MQKKSKRAMLAFVLMMVMILSACGGGNKGGEETAKPADSKQTAAQDGKSDTSNEVKLKMIFLGPKPVDYEQVYAEINKKLKQKINATIEAEFLDWSDWAQKYPLKLAANEDFDLIYSANWAGYSDQALKGGFLELTDQLISTYMPMTWKAMPKESWEQAKVNGKLYMVPSNKGGFVEKLILYREDLRKKYGLPEINSPETFAEYIKAIAKNEPGIIPFTPEAGDWKLHNLDRILVKQKNDWNMPDLDLPLAFKIADGKGQIFNIYETPEFKELLAYYKDLADNNAWSKNVLNSKNDHMQDFKDGKTAAVTQNLDTLGAKMAEIRRDKPEFEAALADLTPNSKKSVAVSTQNGTSIHATSKNPERALMFIDLVQNDKELHDLIMQGIAGTHYEPVGEDKFKSTPQNANYAGYSKWSFDSPLNRVNVTFPQEAADLAKVWEGKVFHYPLETFVFNNANVKTEVANVSNVMLRYAIPLEYGVIPDIDNGLADLNKQMKAAGIDKIQAEMQKQIDEFLAKR
ncbi:ABC transporter substrate-binding protein [Paenibacillus donghaensis]|uniref:ABC transporter substrate-binding protein n=1 Tax=Paenibacillus donghaensis TaxID=414771 RepID=UPI001883FD86|nr:ABC transporter substrate-binding protein [Paenibacillus donghaensis]MBE9915182.1 ABC transporter substrate-binding protein [Paenibacillus donghaensis]